MRYVALATDYDGTLASQGHVDERSVAALRSFRASGRALILVTGRELDELLGIFPDIDVFDRVVAENGALLYCPASGKHEVLGESPSPQFVRELVRRGVAPISVGRSIVATVSPHETAVIAAVRDLGLELQVIFNKGAVMVLPAGVNKATGLATALADLKLSLRNTVAVGDAENDHAMLKAAEFGVAVANALPALKDEADHVSRLGHAGAVIEAMEAVLDRDLGGLGGRSPRRRVALGTLRDGTPVALPAAGSCLLSAGTVPGESARFVGDMLERLVADGYQCFVLDEAGAFRGLRGAILLGRAGAPATPDELAAALAEHPDASVVVDVGSIPALERRAVVEAMREAVHRLRSRLGRPHWCMLQADGDVDRWRTDDGMGIAVAVTRDACPGAGTAVGFDAVVTLGADAEVLMRERLAAASADRNAGARSTAAEAGLHDSEGLLWLARLDRTFVLRPLSDGTNASPHARATANAR